MNDKQLKDKLKTIRDTTPDEVKLKGLESLQLKLDLLASIGAKGSDLDKTRQAIEGLEQALRSSISELSTLTRVSKTENNVNSDKLLEGVESLKEALTKLPQLIQIPEAPDNKKELEALKKAVEKIKLDPKINVKASDVKIDLKPLNAGLQAVLDAVLDIKIPEPKDVPETDLTPVVEALSGVEKMVQKVYERPIPVPQFGDDKIVEAIEAQGGGDSKDAGNSSNDALANGATFTGDWTEVKGQSSIAVFAFADQQLTDYRVEWSSDGVSVNTDIIATSDLTGTEVETAGFFIYYEILVTAIDKYYRITATNASGSNATVTNIYTWVYPQGFPGVYIGLSDSLNDFSRGLLTRSVIAGVDANGVLTNQVQSGQVDNLSTSTPLLANTQFEPTEFFDMNGYTTIKFSIQADEAYDETYYTDTFGQQGGILIEISNDGSTVTSSFVVRTNDNPPSEFLEFAPYFRYFRVKYANGATDQGTFNLGIEATTTPAVAPVTSVGANLTNTSLALGVKSVTFGKQPDGDYEASRQSGSDNGNSTQTLLTAGEIFLGDWFDTSGYTGGQITVDSDQNSIVQGLKVQFTEIDPTTLLTGTFTADAGTDTITATAHGFNDDDTVHFTSDDTLPVGIHKNLKYYVINSDTNTFQISEEEGGSAVDITDTGTGTHTFVEEPLIHRELTFTYTSTDAGRTYDYPVNQGEYYRICYANNSTGQNTFVLRAELMAQAGQIPLVPYDTPSTDGKLAVGTKAVIEAEDEDSGTYSNVQQKNGGIKATIVSHEADTPIKSFSSWSTQQRNVGSTNPIQLASTPLSGRKEIVVVNDSASTKIALGPSSSVTFGTGEILAAQKDWTRLLNDSGEVWAIADSSLGAENTTELSPGSTDSSSGITSPNNVFASDDTRTSIDANADTATYTINNFTFPGSDDTITAVRIGFEGQKQSGQKETTAHQETVSQTQEGGTSITSPSISGGTDQCYVAYIANGRTNPRTIATVTGLGLTWTEQGEIINSSGDGAIAVWVATGSPSAGTVTANFATGAVDSAAITVSRYSGVDQSSPVQGVDTHEASGSGANTYTSDAITGTVTTGRFVAGINTITKTGTITTPANSRADIDVGGDVNLEVRSGTAASSNTLDGNTTGSPDWVAAMITLRPADGQNPEIELSYEISAVAGDTSLVQIISSEMDEDYTVDVTSDRSWTQADLNDTKLILSGSDVSASAAEIDHIYIEVDSGESTNTVRVSISQWAE